MTRIVLIYAVCLMFFHACKSDHKEGPKQAEEPSDHVEVQEVVSSDEKKSSDTILTIAQKKEATYNDNATGESAANSNTEKQVSQAKTQKQTPKGVITFAEDTYDFGEIEEGDIINHRFEFKNTGKAAFSIKKVDVTCGCTTPSYPFIPIRPGEEGYIEVQYNSVGKSGMQKPMVTLYSDAHPRKVNLYLKGVVTEKKND